MLWNMVNSNWTWFTIGNLGLNQNLDSISINQSRNRTVPRLEIQQFGSLPVGNGRNWMHRVEDLNAYLSFSVAVERFVCCVFKSATSRDFRSVPLLRCSIKGAGVEWECAKWIEKCLLPSTGKILINVLWTTRLPLHGGDRVKLSASASPTT